MQPTLVSQQSLPPVLTIKVKKIVGGWFDPLNSLELFYSISSIYDLCRIVHTALELILDIYLQPLEIGIKKKKNTASNWFEKIAATFCHQLW